MIQTVNLPRRNMLKKMIALIVVSEETGTISVAEGGHLTRRFDEQTLAAKIRPAFVKKDDQFFGKIFSGWRGVK